MSLENLSASHLSTLGLRRKRKIAKAHHGVFADVARACGRTRQLVRLVFWGKSTSANVLRLLEAELEKRGAFDDSTLTGSPR